MSSGQLKNSFNTDPSEEEISGFAEAARTGDSAAVVKFLDKYNAAVDVRHPAGWTSLTYAAWWGRQDIVGILLAKGAVVNQKDGIGCTPLMYAAQNGNKEIVEMLLESGASVDVENKVEKTALVLARESLRTEIVELLEQWPEMQRRRQAEQKKREMEAELRVFSQGLNHPIPVRAPFKFPTSI